MAENPVNSVEIQIPVQTDYVSFVRVVVAAVAELPPSPGTARIDDLRVAVSEATTNAIQAHQRVGSLRPITLNCLRQHDTMTVTVRDHGDGFDIDSIPELPPPESPERLRHESGMGVAIMRTLVDESSINSGPQGTEISLLMRCTP